jgi:uncharacterized membrane protein
MQELYKSGRYFFAFAIIAFGIIQFNVQDFMSSFLPIPKEMPARNFFLYLISTLFVAGGIAMCIKNLAGRAAFLIGMVFLLLFFYPHLKNLLSDLHNPGPWTTGAEDLALCGGAFIIAGYIEGSKQSPNLSRLPGIGRILFALSLIVFSVQHFLYADFISTLISSWIPFKIFWAYFVGIAFLAASAGILMNIKARLACILLGFMFLFWVIFLHLPRVAADTHKETEKTSMFIAFAFSGIFFTLASQYPSKARRSGK